MPKKSEKLQERQEAIERLREWIKPGATLRTILRHRSSSGMSHVISVIGIGTDGTIEDYSFNVAKALDLPIDRDRGGVKVSGCGMDMGFHVVYELSRKLFPEGFGCVGSLGRRRRCPSNDHSNGDRDYTPHEEHATSPEHACSLRPETCTAKKHWHANGGYALRQEWL